MTPPRRPTWRLPPGVARGLWEYCQSPQIAEQYDDYFAYNSLFALDQEVVNSYFQAPGVVVDLGAGTGRALLPLVRLGMRGVAIDLSAHMLRLVREKAIREGLALDCVRMNLVEMDGLADRSADYCMCLFSTLGMIQGAANRRKLLDHVRRILKPGGLFVLHAHNFWYNLRDPGGPWWVTKSLLISPWLSGLEVGDKYFTYRGVPNMFLHVFRWGELSRELRRAGFQIVRRVAVNDSRRGALRRPWLLPRLRANGWIVVCK